MSSGWQAPTAPRKRKLVLRGLFLTLLVLALFNLQPRLTALQQVQARGELTLVGISGPTTFFEHNGQARGFQYELARLFAEELGVKLVVAEARDTDSVIRTIRRAQADVAITGLASGDPRLQRVRTGQPYLEVSQQLVYRTNRPQPVSFSAIENATIAVSAGSSEALKLRELVRYRPDMHLLEIARVDATTLLDMVDSGKADYAALNSNELDARRALFPDLDVALNLEENAGLSWAFVKTPDTSLYRAAQAFLDRIENDGTLDRLAAFYGQGKTFDGIGVRAFQRDIAKRLPQYQKLFEDNAKRNSMDWLLLAAIAYQESKWQPHAVSPTGVQGIMMLTRSTAAYLKVDNRSNPVQSIRGGAAYYREMADRLPDDVREPDRTWMALAAYNMGPAYIDRARKNAAKAGDDAGKWLHVSRHLREMATAARQQGRPVPPVGQALHYVQEVRRYYDALLLANNLSANRYDRVASTTEPGRQVY